MKHLFRVAAISPRVHIGNVKKNCEEILKFYKEYVAKADLLVTPELSMTGYTCQDLFFNQNLLVSVKKQLVVLAKATKEYGKQGAALIVGFPFEKDGELFNCAALLHNGEIVTIIPKTYLPNYGEFYEKRWFSARTMEATQIQVDELDSVLFGNRVIITMGDGEESVKLGVEICEDAWAPVSPGRLLAIQGAEIIVNISASNEVIGKAEYRRKLVSGISSSCICGYVYVSAGRYESTSDLVFSGHNLMYENGKQLGEQKPFQNGVLIKDFQMTKIRHDRLANKSFADNKRQLFADDYENVSCEKTFMKKETLYAHVPITPFVPSQDRKSVV